MAIIPSVGMRRSTRIFGVVKRVDGVRVLRSGRCLVTEIDHAKLSRFNDKSENFNKLCLGVDRHCKENGWQDELWLHKSMDIDVAGHKVDGHRAEEIEHFDEHPNKKFGVVYNRKRKVDCLQDPQCDEDKMFGIKFSHRRRRRRQENSGDVVGFGSYHTLGITTRTHSGRFLAHLLNLLLRHTGAFKLTMEETSSFLFSKGIRCILASNAIDLVKNASTCRQQIFKVYGISIAVLLFWVDFSAIPSYFMHLHFDLSLQLQHFSIQLGNATQTSASCAALSEVFKASHSGPVIAGMSESRPLQCKADGGIRSSVIQPSDGVSTSADGNIKYRFSFVPKIFQKKRSLLKQRRPRKNFDESLPSIVPKRKHKNLVSDATSKFKQSSFSSLEKVQDFNSSKCSTAILATELDRCYRIKGAIVVLEMTESGEWILAAKKDEVTYYVHQPRKVMRPHSTNHFTHDVIWNCDGQLKLEFPGRQNWYIFKDLYRTCFERNLNVFGSKIIPVPGVHEVHGCEDIESHFCRPKEYISLKTNEVNRALMKKTPIYDMDSEDEGWLKKFNDGLQTDVQPLSSDIFELLIDSFEKAFFYNCCGFPIVQATTDISATLVKEDVREAVCGHWKRKREQKRSSLLPVFQQVDPSIRVPLNLKFCFRKKRSSNRRGNHCGRVVKPNPTQVTQLVQNVQQVGTAPQLEEAQSPLARSVETAILKRARAQSMMLTADLAAYKAAKAIKIAEMARITTVVTASDSPLS